LGGPDGPGGSVAVISDRVYTVVVSELKMSPAQNKDELKPSWHEFFRTAKTYTTEKDKATLELRKLPVRTAQAYKVWYYLCSVLFANVKENYFIIHLRLQNY